MAIIKTSVDRLFVVGDLFDSFHGVQKARSELKEKGHEEDSIFEFVQLTAQDDTEARADVLGDLGFKAKEIEFLDEALGSGKIFLCVDSLQEDQCEKVAKIFRRFGAMECENEMGKTPAKLSRRKKSASKRSTKEKPPTGFIKGKIELQGGT